ncbi:holo-ACP synthase [Thiofilum flexile]|uniref:holo-ACP synthase n=1 Tax=Thiofilum flexile TaxID=125627 RepID=UPI00036D85E3|nr:holo-ACP synthase [Thiofilum flexile]
MIIGIGTDIVEIARIERILVGSSQRFVERLLHLNELERFKTLVNPAPWLAKRFATKEAVAKALGTGIGEQARLQEIETCYTSAGKPYLTLHGVTLQTAQALGIQHYQLAVSDERHYAVAFVVLSAG